MPAATTVQSASNAARQLSDGNDQGTTLGLSGLTAQGLADKVGLFGAVTTQPTQAMQAALATGASGNGNAVGILTVYDSAQSPASVVANTTAEQSITVTGVLSTDMVFVNKPTAQAGLGLTKGRVSAANTVKLTFANVTSGALTPTGSENYIVGTVPANLQLSAVLTPASVAANTIAEQSFTVTGLDTGMIVEANKPTTQAGLAVLSARVSAKNTLAVTYINTTTGALTPTAGETYLVSAFNALAAATHVVSYGINVGTLASVVSATTAEQSITEAGIAATDVVVGISKPTTQAGLGIVSGRVSAASTVKVCFVNATAGNLTPTGSEVYNVTTLKPNAAALTSVFTATLTPASVAATTSAEQTFTITGLTSGQPVMAVPNYNLSTPAGIGYAGVRISATNTLAVNFINATAAAVTPPSGTWTVVQINQTTPTAGNFVQLLVTPLQTFSNSLLSSIRSALVSLGAMLGS